MWGIEVQDQDSADICQVEIQGIYGCGCYRRDCGADDKMFKVRSE